MIKFDVTLEETVTSDAAEGFDELEIDFKQGNYYAAEEGIKRPYERHPYTDRTTDLTMSMRAEMDDSSFREGAAEMVVGMHYASYVNDKPRFEFMSKAEAAATRELDRQTKKAIARFEKKMNRRSATGGGRTPGSANDNG
jgi:Fe-S oxidoreductase